MCYDPLEFYVFILKNYPLHHTKMTILNIDNEMLHLDR